VNIQDPLKIAAHLARYVSAVAVKDDKLMIINGGGVALTPLDRVTLLFFLCYDKDPETQAAAKKALSNLSFEDLLSVLSNVNLHPRIIQSLAHLHQNNQRVITLLSERQDLDPVIKNFVAKRQEVLSVTAKEPITVQITDSDAGQSALAEDTECSEEETEEFMSKYQLAQVMGTADKIKMALTGDKEWRSIFLKDANKLVSGSVVKNPRITESEILTISKLAIQNDDIIRTICANKEWLKNYQIRKALVENSKTPLPHALRFMATLTEKDLANIAKSKNVSTVISTQARRILLSKQKK